MVNDDIKIALLGGDRRQIYALEAISRMEGELFVCGLPKELVPDVCGCKVHFCDSLSDAVLGADVIVLPFPTSSDGVRINSPLDREGHLSEVKLSSLLTYLDASVQVIGGKLPPAFASAARDKGAHVFDLLELDYLEVKNAHITAEAAVSVAMNNLNKCISASKIAITGFGRISKHLSRMLSSLGADVTVAARKDSDLAFAESLGYSALKIGGERWCDSLTNGYDVIYNTVPHTIFDRKFLESVSKKTLIVELASVPGGFDICAAQELGTNISWALSLPGKYAPESAGALIGECVCKIIDREVVK